VKVAIAGADAMLMPRRKQSGVNAPTRESAKGPDGKPMSRYVVTFSGAIRSSAIKRSHDRADWHESASGLSAEMTAAIVQHLDHAGLKQHYAHVEPAGALPMAFIECTEAAARVIRNTPGVRSVVKDEPELPMMQPVKRVQMRREPNPRAAATKRGRKPAR
jgi:hypothetical protein